MDRPLFSVLLVGPSTDEPVVGGGVTAVRNLKAGLADRVHFHHVGVPSRSGLGLLRRLIHSVNLFAAAAWIAVRYRPKVAHIFVSCRRTAFFEKALLASFLRLFRVPCIFNFRSAFDYYYRKWRPFERSLARRLLRVNRMLVGQYAGLHNFLIEEGLVAEGQLSATVGNGIEMDSAAPSLEVRRNAGVRPGPWRFLYLGMMIPLKGLEVLVRAAEAARAMTDRPFVVQIHGGEEDERFLTEVHKMVADVGLGDVIQIGGALFGESKREALARAGCVVLPSRVEGFPNVLLEAMSMGVPVLATGVGAVPEVIQHDVDGLICSVDDGDAMGRLMAYMVENPERAAQMGLAARSKVAMNHTLSASCDAFYALYRRAAD